MRKLIITAVLALAVQANAKPLKLETLGAALSTRFVADIGKYVPAIKDAQRASAELANGSITLKVYEPTDCDSDSQGERCEGPAPLAYEVSLPVFEAEKYKCGKDSKGKNLYGVRYQAETPHEVWGEFFETIVLVDNSRCPKSDRGVGYLTYNAEGARGPSMMQFFVDAVYRD